MRITHINRDAFPRGGASIAMLRWHEALLKAGVDSLVVCPYKPSVPHSMRRPRGLQGALTHLLFKAQNACLKYSLGQKYTINLFPRGIAAHVNRLKPDIVHLHWLQGDTLSIEEITSIQAPILWSLHDLWPMAGVEPYPENDWYKTGYPKTAPWIDCWVWKRKRKVIQVSSISAVGASRWLLQEVQASLAFTGQKAFYVPYALNAQYVSMQSFAVHNRANHGRFRILFGATGGIKNSVKGFDRLACAMEHVPAELSDNTEVHVFGSTGADFQLGSVPVHFLGPVASQGMPAVYQQADVFAFPSRYETCGQVKLEALACGVPVVAFNETACAEEIIHGETGWVAAPDDCADFARGLEWAYELKRDPARRAACAEQARKSMIRTHAPEAVARAMLKVYENVLASRRPQA